ncbi:hypothetical protein P8452_38568 [Trifolium repens]|nr:hypothetical protein P8452_38568 [Trifolium repens]
MGNKRKRIVCNSLLLGSCLGCNLEFLLLLQEMMQDMSKTQSKEWSLFCERAASCPGMESSSVCFGHLVFYDSSVIVQSIWSFCLYMF